MTSTEATAQTTRRGLPAFFAAIQDFTTRGLRNLRKPGVSRLQLLETLRLGGKRQLLLIVCDGQQFLLGAGADAITAITRVAAISSSSADSVPIRAERGPATEKRGLLQ